MSAERGGLKELLEDAVGYWERRRIMFNVTIAAVVLAWLIFTWPRFREALSVSSLTFVVVLGVATNVLYSLLYLVDLPMQRTPCASAWRRSRRGVWLVVTALAVLATNDWIADEIYPNVAP
jgi:hypothetical protein